MRRTTAVRAGLCLADLAHDLTLEEQAFHEAQVASYKKAPTAAGLKAATLDRNVEARVLGGAAEKTVLPSLLQRQSPPRDKLYLPSSCPSKAYIGAERT
mmetsp:Transcript_58872/g.140441  ORF Transcript_58872/g.140441 Transcript_58872/m.140441 type:complete len:99 (-) Transcript_58872:31-327(-)